VFSKLGICVTDQTPSCIIRQPE